MTPEQRKQFEKMRTERKQVIARHKKACDGKAVGSTVQVKAGEQTATKAHVRLHLNRTVMK